MPAHRMDLAVHTTENQLMLHHIGKIFTIPVDPDAISDSMNVSFAQSSPLSRSAPIYSYQNSGPRTVQVSFTVHRDLMREFNPEYAAAGMKDPIDDLIDNLDAIALPDYDASNKIVNPPLVSLKLRDEIYIKGVVAGSVGTTFNLPLLNYGTSNAPSYKYAMVTFTFGVVETTPFSASILPKAGGKYRTGTTSKNSANAIALGASRLTGGVY